MIARSVTLLAFALLAEDLMAQGNVARAAGAPPVARSTAQSTGSASSIEIVIAEIDRRIQLLPTERTALAQALRDDQARREATRVRAQRLAATIDRRLRQRPGPADSGMVALADSLLVLRSAPAADDRAFFQSIQFLGVRRSTRVMLVVGSLQAWLASTSAAPERVP